MKKKKEREESQLILIPTILSISSVSSSHPSSQSLLLHPLFPFEERKKKMKRKKERERFRLFLTLDILCRKIVNQEKMEEFFSRCHTLPSFSSHLSLSSVSFSFQRERESLPNLNVLPTLNTQ